VALGGVLEVSSVLGRGSTFSVVLPIAEAPMAQLATVADGRANEVTLDERSTQGVNKTVLAIEDNAANLNLLEAILEVRPHVALLGAAQGSIGLELARQHPPDLILLDLHLPDMQGLEVLQRLGGFPETRDIPVVVISADASQSQIKRLMEAGATKYLTKPIDVEEFLRLIDEMQ
jgi:CheY-like chemotaxis protein